MSDLQKIWVLIPAYNEAKSLPVVIQAVQRKGLRVLVVDDGSADSTFSVAQSQNAEVLKNPVNMGKGKTLQRGIEYLLHQHPDVDALITMDADGQHDPAEIDGFLRARRAGGAFIVGNRMHDPFGMPWIRVRTNKLMSWAISALCRQRIPDTQCGFRLIGKEVLQKVCIETDKFEVETELLLKTARQGFPVISIPIRSIYTGGRVSNIRPFADTLRFFKFLILWHFAGRVPRKKQ